MAIILKKEFRGKFNAHTWEVVTPGRLAVLHLVGNEGALDIWCAYLPASCSKERTLCIRSFISKVQKQDKCLTVMTGDFNFTYHQHDRFNKNKRDWTGGSDTSDSKLWQDKSDIKRLWTVSRTLPKGSFLTLILSLGAFLETLLRSWRQKTLLTESRN